MSKLPPISAFITEEQLVKAPLPICSTVFGRIILSKEEHLILLCGHYEGFDERIKTIVDEEISIGDYVLTGGELPAMVLSDSIIRLLPGVIEKESHEVDSFNDNLLDYPTYTKPKTYKGLEVPEVLLSGDHKKIEEYRNKERIRFS